MDGVQNDRLSPCDPHKPFHFNTSAHLLRIGRERATNLSELLQALRTCSENSIFQHTFRTFQEHHFIREGFSNDFAHWAFSACNEPSLAERLAVVDVREFTSVQAVREQILQIVEEYIRNNPRSRERLVDEPFYFCAADVVSCRLRLSLITFPNSWMDSPMSACTPSTTTSSKRGFDVCPRVRQDLDHPQNPSLGGACWTSNLARPGTRRTPNPANVTANPGASNFLSTTCNQANPKC